MENDTTCQSCRNVSSIGHDVTPSQILVSVCQILLSVCILIGNVLILLVIRNRPALKKTTLMFVANLAATDILAGSCLLVKTIIAHITGLPPRACFIAIVMNVITFGNSFTANLYISLDCYMSVRSLTGNANQQHVWKVGHIWSLIVCSWSFWLVIGLVAILTNGSIRCRPPSNACHLTSECIDTSHVSTFCLILFFHVSLIFYFQSCLPCMMRRLAPIIKQHNLLKPSFESNEPDVDIEPELFSDSIPDEDAAAEECPGELQLSSMTTRCRTNSSLIFDVNNRNVLTIQAKVMRRRIEYRRHVMKVATTILVTFLVCTLPYLVALTVFALCENQCGLSDSGLHYLSLPAVLNCLVNVFIYGIRDRGFRKSVLKMIT